MIRLGTEQRLQDVQLESDSCRMRLHALQEEFRKMEEMVANMLQYKVKIDQLKQENASMKSSYEINLQKYCSHISTLERDNMMLRNQAKKMEAQVLARQTSFGSKEEGFLIDTIHSVGLHGKGDDRDKSKLLLERLKMVEAENSSLVLENEQQRQQYEKCLDEIANQVVQALLAQKTLREECLKLQTRVHDLELQNKHLNIMFQQRLKFTSDIGHKMQHTSYFTTNHVCQTSNSANMTTAAATSQEEMSLDFLGNASSLQSMCSEIMGDDSPGKPQMSSPPPWLRDKLLASSGAEGDTSPSSTTSSTSMASPPAPDTREHILQTKIETEFPATNSSPRVKHIRVYERRTRSLERGRISPLSWARRSERGGNRSRLSSDSHDKSYCPVQRLTQSTSADDINHLDNQNMITALQSQLASAALHCSTSSSEDRLAPQTLLQSLPNDTSPAVLLVGADFNHKSFEAFNKSFEKLLAKNSKEEASSSVPTYIPSQPAESDSVISPPLQNKPVMQASPVTQKLTAQGKPCQSPLLRNPFTLKSPKSPVNVPGQYYYYDYSDEDSDSRPVSRDFSTASTMSLNELLDSSAEGEVALDDEFFSDWSSVCITPKQRIDFSSRIKVSNNAKEAKDRSNILNSSSKSRSTSSSPDISGFHKSHKMSSHREIKSKLADNHNGTDNSQNVIPNAVEADSLVQHTSSNNILLVTNNTTIQDRAKSSSVSQEAATEDVEHTVKEKQNSQEVVIEINSVNKPSYFLPSPSPSPNLSQKSQDLGYASKGSYSQSSPSPSPSIPHRGTPFWLQSTKDPHLFSRNELLTLVVNRDTMGTGSNSTSNETTQTSKLARPGQLILVPQDNDFNFQEFSSASSTNSEDTSPLKMFESRQISDMKSSVIEVKKDGTYIPTRSVGDSSSGTSSSLQGSPYSPVKIPLKIPPPVAKKPTKILKPEADPVQENTKDDTIKAKSNKCPRPGSTNITVGFFLNNQLFPGHTHNETVEDFIKNKNPPGHSQEPFSHFQSKCQSSDSSFENLRVERSGSKDDGYSTMSSDIHPEVLDKFSDTLTQRLLTNDFELQSGTFKNTPTEISVSRNETQRNSDATIHNRDISFDFTSDPDSALETSVHSGTAEMITSSSSQVSTSSSDYPLSPCSTNAFKTAMNVDGASGKPEDGANILFRAKDNTIPSSSRSSSNFASPVSPNDFVPSCCQPPESPRRLAIEFQKLKATKSPVSPVVCRKLSPGSPNSSNKSFSGFAQAQLKQQQPQNQTPCETREVSSSQMVPGIKEPNPTKPSANKASFISGNKCLPKGFYSSPLQKASFVSKASIQTKSQVKYISTSSNEAGCDTRPVFAKSKISISSGSNENSVAAPDMKLLSAPTTKEIPTERNKLTKNHPSVNENNQKLYKYSPNLYAKSKSNTTSLCEFKNSKSALGENLENSAKSSNSELKDVLFNNGSVSSNSSQSSHMDVSVPHSSTVACSNNIYDISAISMDVNIDCKRADNAVSKSSCSTDSEKVIHSSTSFSSEPVTSFSKSHPHCHYHPSNAAENQPSQHTSQIVMTNHGFQFSSDSENNEDDDTSSLLSITFDDNYLEDIPEENDNADVNIPRDFNSNKLNSNNGTTNSSTSRTSLQHLESTTSVNICSDLNNSADEVSLKSSNDPKQHCHQNHIPYAGDHHPSSPPQQFIRQNVTTIAKNKFQFRQKSKSEDNLSKKSMSTSSYDDFFGLAWNSGKVLERSASMSEIDLLPQRSWLFDVTQGQTKLWDVSNNERASSSSSHRSTQWVFLSSPTTSAGSAQIQNQYPQTQCNLLNHPLQHFYNQQQHGYPWVQTLRLDLSDVTELDEDGSELATTHDSLDSSQTDMVNDESPSCDVDEQKRFNSQFYSLCKVDSNRSLLSSGNDSKERLSLTSLNEILNNKSFDNSGESPCDLNIQGLNPEEENIEQENEIAIREFDEISRQIASLSKTVDQLNHSLSSLNSEEFEPSSDPRIESSSCRLQESKTRSSIIDGYHWADDEFFQTSHSGGIIYGSNNRISDSSFGEAVTHSISFDLNCTEDATSEFFHIPSNSYENHITNRNSTGQDEIFAGSFYDTVKEKPTKGKDQGLSGSDGSLNDKLTVAEKCLSVPIFSKSTHSAEKENEQEDKSSEMLQINCQGDDQTDRLTGSNNDSDDSLASDIGLDRMMCQRLFGRKGRVQPSSSHRHIVDIKQLFQKYGDTEKDAVSAFDFLNSFSMFESSSQKQQSRMGISSQEEEKISADEALNSNEKMVSCDAASQTTLSQREICSRETRNVGVDAMSQSQLSMNASFETFDQSIPGLDVTETTNDVLNLPPGRCSSYSLSEASLSQSSGTCDSARNEITDSTQKNIINLSSLSSATEIVAHGGCDKPETRSICCNLTDQTKAQDMNKIANLMSYSDFVADLKQTPAVIDTAPPKLPPRQPIINNYRLNQDIAPLPPPPPCLDNTKFHSSEKQHSNSEKHHLHVPYVNQIVPVLDFHNSNNVSANRPLISESLISDQLISLPPVSISGTLPTPLQHITRNQEGRPQVHIRPQRISQDRAKPEVRPHSFNHYLINKPKPPSSSSLPPAQLSTYPRSRSHSDTTDLSTRTHAGDKLSDDLKTSKIPRRKLKTRRERSQIKQNIEKPSTDAATKIPNNGNLSQKQWRDISVLTSARISDPSCEDTDTS